MRVRQSWSTSPSDSASLAGEEELRLTRVLDLLEMFEFAWHDCYGEITLPDKSTVDQILYLSNGCLKEAHQPTAELDHC